MKNKDKKFELHKKPMKTRPYILPILWVATNITLIGTKYKIIRENFKKIKGGCIIVSNHESFSDFKILQKLIFPRPSYYIASIDEFVKKEGLMRRLGCIPKKVHFMDMALVRSMVRLLKKGNILSIYPEATFSFAGVTNEFDQGLGKLAKLAHVPVIVIHQYGNYLRSPRWNTRPVNKEVPLLAKAKMVVSEDELDNLTDFQIQERINEYFDYDDYKYQRENNIHLKSKTMAEHIERILYKCPNCGKEMVISGKGNDIMCSSCNAKYHIDSLSILKNLNGETKFDSIGDWFKWQRESVAKEINDGTYNISFPCKISRLINCQKGFDHNFALGHATQTDKGIVIDAIINETHEKFHYEYNEKQNTTVHITFSVIGCKDAAFEVHTADESYLIYPTDGTNVVKIRYAVEEANKKHFANLNKKNQG